MSFTVVVVVLFVGFWALHWCTKVLVPDMPVLLRYVAGVAAINSALTWYALEGGPLNALHLWQAAAVAGLGTGTAYVIDWLAENGPYLWREMHRSRARVRQSARRLRLAAEEGDTEGAD